MLFSNKKPTIEYTLKRFKKSKSLKLMMRSNGEVLVTAPSRVSKKYIDNFVAERESWIKEKRETLDSLPQPHIKTKPGDYKKYKQQALDLVKEKIERINKHYKFEYKNISIRDQKTRWGSCSSKKNLSFSYKLALVPDKYAEYVVIHELCHLKEMNHGPNFWKLVEETMSDYKKVQQELHNLRI